MGRFQSIGAPDSSKEDPRIGPSGCANHRDNDRQRNRKQLVKILLASWRKLANERHFSRRRATTAFGGVAMLWKAGDRSGPRCDHQPPFVTRRSSGRVRRQSIWGGEPPSIWNQRLPLSLIDSRSFAYRGVRWERSEVLPTSRSDDISLNSHIRCPFKLAWRRFRRSLVAT